MKKITCLFVGIVFLCLGLISGCGNSEPKLAHPDISFNFSLRDLQDTSIATARRYHCMVRINEEATTVQIEDIARYVTQEIKADRDFQALTIWFVDHISFYNSGDEATLGTVTYAPGGEVRNAPNVRLGDYGEFEFDFNIWHMDWSIRPTDDELGIFALFYNSGGDEGMKKVLMERHDITQEEFDDIVQRGYEWYGQRFRR